MGSKRVSKEEYASLERKILLYNKTPTETKLNIITKMLSTEKAKQEAVKVAAKSVAKKIKKELKKKGSNKEDKERVSAILHLEASINTGETTIEEVEALLKKLKPIEVKASPRLGEKRGGEYYGNN